MKFRHTVFAAALAAAFSTPLAFSADAPYVDARTVRQVQQVLRDRGFPTAVDGMMGPNTQAALKKFQRAENLDPSGQLNRQTLVALGLIRDSASAGSSQPRYSPEIIGRAQRTLNHRGFNAGTVDGTMDERTRSALRAFQKSENLQETGQLNPGTLAALGIDPDASVATGPADTRMPMSATVKEVQERLNSRGYRAGPADGRLGESTRDALRQFQRAENLEVTGRLDSRTLAALGLSGPVATR